MQRLSVSETVWPWRQVASPTGLSAASRRRRGSLEAAVMLVVACLMVFKFDHPVPAAFLVGLATLVLVGAWCVPPLYLGIQRAVLRFGVLLGRTMAWLLLVPFFYIVFTLGRLGFAVAGKDPLQLRFDTARDSYWIPRSPTRGADSYRRQY